MAIYRCAACGAVNRLEGGAATACARCLRALDVSGAPQRVDAAGLVSLIRSSPAPVVVDFGPPGGPPSPAVADLASQRAGEVLFLHVDTGAETAAAAAYGVAATPTLVFFSGGNEVARLTAGCAAGDVARWMDVVRWAGAATSR